LIVSASFAHPSRLQKLIIRSHFHCREQDTSGLVPLHLAARQGLLKSASLLLAAGGDVRFSMLLACPAFCSARLITLLGHQVKAKSDSGQTPLHNACAWGHPELVTLLVEAGSDIHL
jgi:ankyrin repeat protein